MTDYAAWLNVQNGSPSPVPLFQTVPAPNARYINDNRALSAYLRADFSPQGFINASLILNTFGLNALSPGNPYRASLNQSGQGTFGIGEFVGMIAHAAHVALLACWFQKWAVHRKVRPEAFGGAIHNMKTTTARYDIHPEILNSPTLKAIQIKYGTYLLPMAYPEGSPTHPAYPAGHAVSAGAGATTLKAFYDEAFVIPRGRRVSRRNGARSIHGHTAHRRTRTEQAGVEHLDRTRRAGHALAIGRSGRDGARRSGGHCRAAGSAALLQ